MVQRVIQFSTGNVGEHSLRALIGRPDVELVGVHASSPDKVGKDASELCGLDAPVGVIATNDIDELVALNADCVVYTALAETRPDEALNELARFLAAGTNVVGTSLVWLVAPDHADEWLREPMEKACAQGNSTLYINGIDPGFSGDTLVHSALSLSTRAETITVQEIFDYGGYDDAEYTGMSLGFGTSPDETPIAFAPGMLTSIWGGQVQALAKGLGVEVDEMRERHEKWVTPVPIECTMMSVPAGTVAAVRFGVEGIVDGRVAITFEHVNRLTEATGPDWPYPPEGRPGVHRVVVTGDPGVEINVHVGIGLDPTHGGVISTAARAVNVIAAVCDAPPGLLSAHDLRALDHLPGTMW